MKYDVVSMGPARMDAFVTLPQDEVVEVCNIDRQKCMIELGFGEKIAVKGVDFTVGGNTGNNAVGLSRLGHKVAMIGAMGDGWADKRALEVLQGEGVDTQHIEIQPGKQGFGVIINYQEERTILSYYPDSLSKFPQLGEIEANWAYVTSMGMGFEGFYEQAVAWIKNKGIKMAFNPGTRQIKVGVEKLKYAYEACEIIFVNKEEAAQLLGVKPSTEIKQLLDGMKNLGPKVVVITDGPNGTYFTDGGKYLYMPIVPATVVERTGAGDAFGSGFMGAVIAGKTYEEALRWGTVNSASVLGYIGPQAGLLNTSTMQEWLDKNAQIVPCELSSQTVVM